MMALRGPVLAAVNLTDAADETLRQASALASDIDSRLIVCHVLPETLRVRTLFPQFAVADPATQQVHEQRSLPSFKAATKLLTEVV